MHELPKHCNRALTLPVMRMQITTAVAMIPNAANALRNCCPLLDAHLRLRDSPHAFTDFLIYPLAALWLKHNMLTAMTTQLYALTDAWCITPSDCLSSPSNNHFQICMVSLDGIPRTCAHACKQNSCRITPVVAVRGRSRHAASNVHTSSACFALH